MKKLAVLLVVLTLAAAAALTSCGGAGDDELISSLEALAPGAGELYRVIYADVLPHGEAEEDGYCKVSTDADYTSIAAIQKAMSEVFTPEYCQILSNTAFSGISVDEGSIGAKFAEENGVLYVNPSVTEDFAMPRTFDLSSAKVVKKNNFMAIIRIPHADGDVEVTMRRINGAWLIDSPMF